MINIWTGAILSTIIVSVVSLAGIIFVSIKVNNLQKLVLALVSFAVGGLFGNAFFHLLPEAYESIQDFRLIAILVMAGLVSLFLLEKFFHWQHNHNVDEPKIKAMGYISIFADGFHNFTDGILIAASWMVSPEVGIATTVAVVLHEIPQEISDFGILVHSGFSRKKALLLNFYSACAAILGAIITLIVGSGIEEFSVYVLPFAAGGFIYLAGSDLIPELHKDFKRSNAVMQLVMILAGLALMYSISIKHSHQHEGHENEHPHTEVGHPHEH